MKKLGVALWACAVAGVLVLGTYDVRAGGESKCAAGSAPTNGKCLPCAPGTFAAAGAVTCSLCNAGTYSDTPGAVACRPCNAGFSAKGPGMAACYACDAGTYASDPGAVICNTCAANTYSSAGSIACTPCAPGAVSPPGAASCTLTPTKPPAKK